MWSSGSEVLGQECHAFAPLVVGAAVPLRVELPPQWCEWPECPRPSVRSEATGLAATL